MAFTSDIPFEGDTSMFQLIHPVDNFVFFIKKINPFEHFIFTSLFIFLILSLIFYILKDSNFFKSGFRFKSLIVLLFFSFSCYKNNEELDENRNDAPVKALMDYHYGVKYHDTLRFKESILDYQPQHINVAMLIFQSDVACDIVWEYDSFIGKDSVWVHYREIGTVWGNTLHKKLFVRYKGRWARKIGYD